jgi:hypothetical protein
MDKATAKLTSKRIRETIAEAENNGQYCYIRRPNQVLPFSKEVIMSEPFRIINARAKGRFVQALSLSSGMWSGYSPEDTIYTQ